VDFNLTAFSRIEFLILWCFVHFMDDFCGRKGLLLLGGVLAGGTLGLHSLLTLTLLNDSVTSTSLVGLLGLPVLLLLFLEIRIERSHVWWPPRHQCGTNSGLFQVRTTGNRHGRFCWDMIENVGGGAFCWNERPCKNFSS
jgi:hypothetical protein